MSDKPLQPRPTIPRALALECARLWPLTALPKLLRTALEEKVAREKARRGRQG